MVFSRFRGKREYEEPRFMSVAQAAAQLLEIVNTPQLDNDDTDVVEEIKISNQEENEKVQSMLLTSQTICVGMARVGMSDEKIVAGCLKDLADVDMGGPLHSLIICGPLHPMEKDYLRYFAVNDFLDREPIL